MYKVVNKELAWELKHAPKAYLEEKANNLLRYLRRENSDMKEYGVCSVCHVIWYTQTLTGSSYPISGHPWETNAEAYKRMHVTATMHLGYANKQRRKLARQLLNIIKQELRTRNES